MNNGDSRFPKALLFSFHCGTRYRLSRRHLRELLFGTGSMPPRPNELQRSTLHTARASPRIAPHSFTASIAYCEQVGVNRQQGFLSGDMNFRYRVISHISTYFMTVYSRGRFGVEIRRIFNRAPPGPAKNLLERRFLDFQELLSKEYDKSLDSISYIGFTEKGHSTLCRSPVGCFSGKIRADLRRKARAFRTQRQGRVSPLPRSRRQPVRVRKSR